MTTARKVAAAIALLGWMCIFGTCVVGVVTTERVSDEDAVYVIIENGTSHTLSSITIGGNYKTSEHIRKTFKPGDRTREYKRGLTVGSYSSIHVDVAPKGYANVRGIPELAPGHYVIKLIDSSQANTFHTEILPQK